MITMSEQSKSCQKEKVVLLQATFLQKHLLASLQKVAPSVWKYPPLPILDHVLLEARNGKGTCMTSNLEMVCRVHFDGIIVQEGAIAIPYQMLVSTIKTLKKTESVTLLATGMKDENGKVSGQQIILTASDKTHCISCLDAQEFPAFPSCAEYVSLLKLPIETLARLVLPVGMVAPPSHSDPILTNVHLTVNEGTLWIAATDKNRFSYGTRAVEPHAPFSLLLPARFLLPALKVLPSQEIVTLGINEDGSRVSLEAGTMTILLKTMEGKFPTYAHVLFPHFDSPLLIDRSLLQETLTSLLPLAKQSFSMVKMTLTRGKMCLEAGNDEERKKMNSEIPYTGGSQKKMTLLFNITYLLTLLKAMKDSPTVVMSLHPSEPCLFSSPSESEDGQVKHVIMPMRPNR